jgi:hypothetical protein
MNELPKDFPLTAITYFSWLLIRQLDSVVGLLSIAPRYFSLMIKYQQWGLN